ncbi:HD domain-containing protein [bacterium]|nr:HD domain-containing protein [bacterium]
MDILQNLFLEELKLDKQNLVTLQNKIAEVLNTQQEKFKKLNRIGVALSAESNLNVLLEMIVLASMEFTNADGGTLYLITPDEKHAEFVILRTNSLNFKMGGSSGNKVTFYPIKLFLTDETPNHQQVTAHVAFTGKTVNIPDVYEVEGFDFQGTKSFDNKTGYRSKSMLVIPLKNHESEIIGVLQLLNAQDENGKTIPFSKESQEIIESLASQAAIATTNTQLIKELRELLESFIQVIASAIDKKSPYTGGHIRRVADITMKIAEAVHNQKKGVFGKTFFSADEMNELRVAAWMHDIGKITTPEYIVDKATKLQTIHDRIETVITRFELLKRDYKIQFLGEKEQLVKEGKDFSSLEKNYEEKISEIENDCKFIQEVNIGGEFLSNEKVDLINQIAKKYKVTIKGENRDFLDENEVYNLSIRKGTLTKEERDIINYHIVVTIDMLESLPYPKKLRNVPEYAGGHHEKLDGTGYPKQLSGQQLSTQAKIMAVADIFEALTAQDRPYKLGKKMSESIRILEFFVKDKHIDGDILEVFIESGLCAEYAKNELHPDQLDEFEFKGNKYDFSIFKEYAKERYAERMKQNQTVTSVSY